MNRRIPVATHKDLLHIQRDLARFSEAHSGGVLTPFVSIVKRLADVVGDIVEAVEEAEGPAPMTHAELHAWSL